MCWCTGNGKSSSNTYSLDLGKDLQNTLRVRIPKKLEEITDLLNIRNAQGKKSGRMRKELAIVTGGQAFSIPRRWESESSNSKSRQW
jgi:hypothetical protein